MATTISHNPNLIPNQSVATQTAIIVDLPPQSLVQLPPGSLIDAKVIAKTPDGKKMVSSIFGRLTIKTKLEFPINSSLELQIVRYKPHLQLIPKRINGVEVTQSNTTQGIKTITKNVQNMPTTLSTNTSINDTKASKLDVGAQIQVVLIKPNSTKLKDQVQPPEQRPASKKRAPVPATSKMQPHEKTNAKQEKQRNLILGTLATVFQEFRTFGTNSPHNAAILNKLNSIQFLQKFQSFFKNNQNQPSAFSEPLQPGTKLTLNFLGTIDNSTHHSKIYKFDGNMMDCMVIATTPTGQPILNTPIGIVAVESKVPLETGLVIQLEIIPNQITKPAINSPAIRFELIYQSKEWINLVDAINEMELVSPQVAKNFINNALPQPNSQLASNLLFFLNALKIGNFRSWIGKTATSLLAQIKPQLLSQLDEDFALLSRSNTEPQPNEWRTAIIPLFGASGLEQFQLHTQIQSDRETKENMDNNSRFIIDISLSRIGRIQLDGFLRKKRKQLDLIIRTEGSLPKKMRIEISKIYRNLSEISKFTGQMTFQVNQNFVEIPMPHYEDQSIRGVVI